MFKKETLKGFLLSAFFAVLTAVGGMLSIPMPPIPFTMQTFFVLMSGLLLGPKYGPLSQALYIAMGLAGMPVFAGGSGGLHRVFSPSFGFLIGFVAASWVAGAMANGVKPSSGKPHDGKPLRPYVGYALVCFAATVVLYAVALPCFYVNMRYVAGTPVTITRTLQVALLPFIIPDLIKALAAGALACRAIPALRSAGLLPVMKNFIASASS
jgi:biotin transport system substrate-specific component